ncbi:MAG: DUF1801 domain-containing protein [Sediminibacterium sp.]
MKTTDSIDAYIASCPGTVQPLLEQLRTTIRKAVPDAEEVISYGMPAFKQHKVLVYFAAFKNHIGFYPTSSGVAAFRDELVQYKSSKGAIQFPLTQKLPLALITKIVKFRLKEVQGAQERGII